MMAALEFLRVGCRWQIGMGHSVNIWKVPWIPRTPSFLVITPNPHDTRALHVSDLILEDTSEWDVGVVNDLFWLEDRDLILQILLSLIGTSDLLCDGGRTLGFRILARNAEGSYLAWLSFKLDRGGSMEVVEALAAREAICIALWHQWRRVILEDDCSSLMSKLSSVVVDLVDTSPFAAVIRSLSSQIGMFPT
ncbi:UNVERIFIED_CONTAM: hypothetical protein Scaly_2260500 [Sesamum calycinum]|uniref:RNase H type-1 domain-containing protein n=1 Tax=Sesamum calycinum TaxID=2727403 RepID=A0AAW2M9U1_9LAMI